MSRSSALSVWHGSLDGVIPAQEKQRSNIHALFSIPEGDPDWRPATHQFTEAELRDRFMRYGGVDAATAWALVWFIRGRIPDIDLIGVFAASGLGFAMPTEFGLAL